ncbi:hypothetical protein ACX1HV_06430 [Yersinia enterocolitica]
MMAMQLLITDLNGTCFTEDGIYQVVVGEDSSCFICDDEGNEHPVNDLIVDGVSFRIEPLELF